MKAGKKQKYVKPSTISLANETQCEDRVPLAAVGGVGGTGYILEKSSINDSDFGESKNQ